MAARINPWFAFKHSGAPKYLAVAVIVLVISIGISLNTQSWSWVSRAGGIWVLFGVLLSLRRLFRLGPQRLEEPTEPQVINGNQLNMAHIRQSIQQLTDNFAQACGVTLMVAGTLLGSYGDAILQLLVPY